MSKENAIKVLLTLPSMRFPGGLAMGHVMRCLSLAREIANRGAQVLFLAAGREFSIVTKEGFPALKQPIFPYLHHTYLDLLTRNYRIVSISAMYKPNVIVSDTFPYLSVSAAKYFNIPHILITSHFSMFDLTYSFSDLIILLRTQDQLTYIPSNIPKGRIVYAGPILSQNLDHIKGQYKKNVRNKLHIPNDKLIILVTVGGSTVPQETLRMSVEAYNIVKEEIPKTHIILNDPNRLFPKTHNKNLTVTRWIPNLLEYMLASDLVINHGGHTTVSEAAAVGAPQIIIPSPYKTEARQNASWIENSGAGIYHTLESLTPEKLAKRVIEILEDTKTREAMSKAGKKLVDGKGVARATQLILDYAQLN